MSVIDKFVKGMARSREGFTKRLDLLFKKGELNSDFYEQLEEILIAGDIGVDTALKLIAWLREEAKNQKIESCEELRALLLEKVSGMLAIDIISHELTEKPEIILLVGVNGSGKTTSAAKLAGLYREQGKKVLLVAGDTFRAAAIEQLEIWSNKAGVDLIRQQAGSDPSAIFFDAINAAKARGTDLIIGDTAGRLHNKYNLMEELKKIYRVIGHKQPGAPHQVLLVVDATTGQNAIAQAKSFNEALPLTGLILTKLDGTARGGIVLAIRDSFDLPVLYVGTGEKMEDLTPFDAKAFAEALLQ